MKTAKAPKDQIDAEVKILLELKAKLNAVAKTEPAASPDSGKKVEVSKNSNPKNPTKTSNQPNNSGPKSSGPNKSEPKSSGQENSGPKIEIKMNPVTPQTWSEAVPENQKIIEAEILELENQLESLKNVVKENEIARLNQENAKLRSEIVAAKNKLIQFEKTRGGTSLIS